MHAPVSDKACFLSRSITWESRFPIITVIIIPNNRWLILLPRLYMDSLSVFPSVFLSVCLFLPLSLSLSVSLSLSLSFALDAYRDLGLAVTCRLWLSRLSCRAWHRFVSWTKRGHKKRSGDGRRWRDGAGIIEGKQWSFTSSCVPQEQRGVDRYLGKELESPLSQCRQSNRWGSKVFNRQNTELEKRERDGRWRGGRRGAEGGAAVERVENERDEWHSEEVLCCGGYWKRAKQRVVWVRQWQGVILPT